jgi:3-carboxy-cis,cis-muconate cycloisomerase
MEQEHERAAGAWHSEWPALTELLRTVGSAASWLEESLDSLRVDTARMAATVAAGAEPTLASAATEALAGSMGRGAAHELVARAVRTAHDEHRPLAEVLARHPELDVAALSVTPDVGEAAAQVDAVLSEHVRVVYGEPA